MSIPQHIVSKLNESADLAMRMGDFGKAQAVRVASKQLSDLLEHNGEGRAGYALRHTVSLLKALSRDAFTEDHLKSGYIDAAKLIEDLVENYGYYDDQPSSFFEAAHPLVRPSVAAQVEADMRRGSEARAFARKHPASAEADSDYSVDELLQSAEAELLAWASGNRSSTNAQFNAEVSPEDRGETLVRIAQQDAAELELAIRKVEALRLLSGQRSS